MCVLKSLTSNDARICNGTSLKVEAMILSSRVILFGWSLRFILTEAQNESEKC